MISPRLWQQVIRPDHSNPIIRRFRHSPPPAAVAARTSRRRRLVYAAVAIALILIALNPSQILVLIFILPMLMITLIVLAPLLLPLLTLLAGAGLVAETLGAIVREKHQHTYELMCACTEGALYANWSCAIGVLHRGFWFAAMRWGTRVSLRLGLFALGLLLLLMLALIAFDHQQVGAEQLRILLVTAALLLVYGSQLAQTLLTSLLIGLIAGSFDWHRRDALLAGALIYAFAAGSAHRPGRAGVCGGRRARGRRAFRCWASARRWARCWCLCWRGRWLVALLWAALRRRLEWGRSDEKSAGGMAAVGVG